MDGYTDTFTKSLSLHGSNAKWYSNAAFETSNTSLNNLMIFTKYFRLNIIQRQFYIPEIG